jgi:hypothetical protein
MEGVQGISLYENQQTTLCDFHGYIIYSFCFMLSHITLFVIAEYKML